MPDNRPPDRTRSNDSTLLSHKEKNSEVQWVISQYRKLYASYRTAEHALHHAEQNADAGNALRRRQQMGLTAEFNRAQFRLEYALGAVMPLPLTYTAEELRWINPELKQLRNRATGEF